VAPLRTAICGTLLLLAMAFAALAPLSHPGGPAVALAASPAPSAETGDTRSAGEAPGFVGSPLIAVVAVLGLGAVAAAATIAYVRLTGGPGRSDGPPAASR
jgi:hypothetical protein